MPLRSRRKSASIARLSYRRLRRKRLSLVEKLEDRRLLAVYTVNDFGDLPDANPGDGVAAAVTGGTTLRAAIMEANASNPGGMDTIELPAGTFRLQREGAWEDAGATGDLDILGDLTIVGAGAGNTIIDASALATRDRVLHVHRGDIADRNQVRIEGVTITGGEASAVAGTTGSSLDDRGGAVSIDFYADVTIVNSIVRDNSAPRASSTSDFANVYGVGGAINNSGNLQIISSRFENNSSSNSGGAIYVGGSGATTSIRDSVFENNSSRDGGALEARYLTTIENSTFVGNTAFTRAGTSGNGGAIKLVGGELTLLNSTFSDNAASGGGALSIYGTLRATHTTFTENSALNYGGGVQGSFGDTQLILENSIIAGNSAGTNGADVYTAATVNSGGHNLIGDTSGASGWVASDLQNVTPQLLPLTDNGGTTPTHALAATSPAIDAAGGNLPASDQRGVLRPQGGAGDIGAFEFVASGNQAPQAVDDVYSVAEDAVLAIGDTTGVPGAVLRYTFDEAAGGATPTTDLGIAPAADGTFHGAATRIADTPGGASVAALDLTTGTNQNSYVSDGDADKIDALTELSLSLWLNLRDVPMDEDVLLSDRPAYPAESSTSGWEFRIVDSPSGVAATADAFWLEFETAHVGTGIANGQSSLRGPFSAAQEWIYVALTLDSSGLASWYAGDETQAPGLVGQTRFSNSYLPTAQDNPTELRIGGSSEHPDEDHTPPAWLDDVRVYDRALQATELDTVRSANLHTVSTGVLANDSDPEQDPLTAVLVSGPQHGTLNLSADGSFQYTPNANYHGPDSFTYRASDGTTQSELATVAITVLPTQDAPTAAADSATTTAGTATVIDVLDNDSDIDGDSLRVASLTQPENGSASLNPDGTVTYTPDAGFSGNDIFQYTVTDDNGGSDSAQVSVTVLSANAAPVAHDDAYSTPQGVAFQIGQEPEPAAVDQQSLAHDHVISASHYSLQQQVQAGVDGRLDAVDLYVGGNTTAGVELTFSLYRGAPWQTGTAAFTTQLQSSSAMAGDWISIDTSAADFDLAAGELYTIGLTATRSSTSQLMYLGMSRENLSNDSYREGKLWSDGSVHDPSGVGFDLSFRTHMQVLPQQAGVLVNDTDSDGDPLTALLVSNPSHGSLSLSSNGGFLYTPAPDFVGTDSFTYRAHDGQAASNLATATITVTAVNRRPDAVNDFATTAEDTAVTIDLLANDSDPDGDPLELLRTTSPTHGTVTTNADGTVTYTPNANFHGTDTFYYSIADDSGASDTAIVTVTVTPANDAPVAVDDSAATAEDNAVTIDVLDNDSDIDGDALTVSIDTAPSNGVASVNADGTITYTPAANFHGSDAFVYQIDDGNGGTATAEVMVTVRSGTLEVDYELNSRRINLGSHGKVSITLWGSAQLSGDEIDAASVVFADAYAIGWQVDDVDGDGIEDLVLKFSIDDIRDALFAAYSESDSNSRTRTVASSLTGRTVHDEAIMGFEMVDVYLAKQKGETGKGNGQSKGNGKGRR